MRVQTDSLLIITLKYYKYIDIFPYELCTITQRISRDYQSKAWTLCVVGWLVNWLPSLGGRGRRTRRKRLIRFCIRTRPRRTYRNNNCSWFNFVYLDTDTVLCLEFLTAECHLVTSLQEPDMSAILDCWFWQGLIFTISAVSPSLPQSFRRQNILPVLPCSFIHCWQLDMEGKTG